MFSLSNNKIESTQHLVLGFTVEQPMASERRIPLLHIVPGAIPNHSQVLRLSKMSIKKKSESGMVVGRNL